MFKFLLVEDSKEDIDVCLGCVEKLNDELKAEEFKIVIAEEFDKAVSMINEGFDGAIVDIRLKGDKDGNDVIKSIIERNRLPVVIMSGTPDQMFDDIGIQVCIKGQDTYEKVIKELIKQNETGLFKVLGRRGFFEETLNNIFWSNFYPQIKIWEDYQAEGIETEKIITRYFMTHIFELLDYDGPDYCSVEVYIKPPILKRFNTGTIVLKKGSSEKYVLLSPPCDLAVHDGNVKTDQIIMCLIESYKDRCATLIGDKTAMTSKTNSLKKLLNNNEQEYYHWLPENELFEGGLINFRKVYSIESEKLFSEYEIDIKISDVFVKNILNRFSRYYARQGQPDLNFNREASYIVTKHFSAIC